jgi:hypothetical protein
MKLYDDFICCQRKSGPNTVSSFELIPRSAGLEAETRNLKLDDLVKSQEIRHSCESRSPELIELTGFPLPRE